MAYLVPDAGKPGETVKIRVKDARFIGTGPTVYRVCANKNLTNDEYTLAGRSIRVIPLSIKYVPPDEYEFDIEISSTAKAFEYDITLGTSNQPWAIQAGVFRIDSPVQPLTVTPTSTTTTVLTTPIPVKKTIPGFSLNTAVPTINPGSGNTGETLTITISNMWNTRLPQVYFHTSLLPSHLLYKIPSMPADIPGSKQDDIIVTPGSEKPSSATPGRVDLLSFEITIAKDAVSGPRPLFVSDRTATYYDPYQLFFVGFLDVVQTKTTAPSTPASTSGTTTITPTSSVTPQPSHAIPPGPGIPTNRITEAKVKILEAEASILEALSKEAAKRITDADWLKAAAEKECCAAKLIEALELAEGDILIAGPAQLQPATVQPQPVTIQPQPATDQTQMPTIAEAMKDYKIAKIEGIGKVYEERFNEVGIETTGDFLARTSTPSMREALAEETGISPRLILEWTKRADLMRINGVGEEWSDLLELIGVESVEDLATRDPDVLFASLEEFNKEDIIRRKPARNDIIKWIMSAKDLTGRE